MLRGLALLVMIETHIVNAYLPGPVRLGRSFFWLSFLNGLVAPTFLFASGFSVLLLGSRQWEDWLRFRRPFWRQMRRLGFITLIAYYTHLQGFRLSRYLADPRMWKGTLRVDILQCIVASLLLVHLLILISRTPRVFVWCAAVAAVLIALFTPWVWARDFTRLPLSLVVFMNPQGVSLFPLFPWTSFLLAGACAGALFVRSVRGGTTAAYMRILVVIGVAAVPLSIVGRYVPLTLPGRVDFYTTSPLYVLLRLGCVLLICAGLYRFESRLTPGRRAGPAFRVFDAVRLAGQESLLVYGVHLWLIFAVMRGKHLGPILGLQAGYAGCFAWAALVIALLLWLARGWHTLKARHERAVRWGQAAVVVTVILVFVLL